MDGFSELQILLADSYEAVDNTESAKIHATAAIEFAQRTGHDDAVAQVTAYLDQLESRDTPSTKQKRAFYCFEKLTGRLV